MGMVVNFELTVQLIHQTKPQSCDKRQRVVNLHKQNFSHYEVLNQLQLMDISLSQYI